MTQSNTSLFLAENVNQWRMCQNHLSTKEQQQILQRYWSLLCQIKFICEQSSWKKPNGSFSTTKEVQSFQN